MIDPGRKKLQTGLVQQLLAMFGELRFPWLFAITASVFAVDLVVPDLIPFADELLLGLATILLGAWRKRKDDVRNTIDASPSATSAGVDAGDNATGRGQKQDSPS